MYNLTKNRVDRREPNAASEEKQLVILIHIQVRAIRTIHRHHLAKRAEKEKSECVCVCERERDIAVSRYVTILIPAVVLRVVVRCHSFYHQGHLAPSEGQKLVPHSEDSTLMANREVIERALDKTDMENRGTTRFLLIF
jgi:hypothetical protein